MKKFTRSVFFVLIFILLSTVNQPARAGSPAPLQAARKLQAVDHYAGPEEFGGAPEAKAAGDFKPAAGIEAAAHAIHGRGARQLIASGTVIAIKHAK